MGAGDDFTVVSLLLTLTQIQDTGLNVYVMDISKFAELLFQQGFLIKY